MEDRRSVRTADHMEDRRRVRTADHMEDRQGRATPPAPTLAFGVLETASAPALVPALPQSELIEEEQDDVEFLATSMEEGKFEGGTEDPSCLEGSPSETYMAPSGPLVDELAALVSRAAARVQIHWTEESQLQTEAGTSSRNDDGEAAAVVQRAEVEEPPRPEPRPRRKRPEEPGTRAAAAEPGAAAPADADKEGVFAAVIKKRKLKKRTSAAADPAAGEEESVWGPIMVSHDSGVGSQPSAVVEPSAGSEGQEKSGPQPADLLSEDSVQEGSDVGGDSLGAQAGPVDAPPSDETPQPAAGSLQTEAGTSSRNDDGEAAAVVQRAEVEEPPRPEPRPRRKRPEEPGTSAAAAEPGAAAPADADKEGVFAAVIKKRKLKKRTSAAADPAAGEEESVWGPIMVSHDSDVGSQPSAVVEPSAGSEGQEKGGPQPADLVSEDPVLEGSDVGGDSLGAQAGPVDVPPSDETPQPAGSVAEMPAADGDSAGEEENGSDEDGWEDGLSDTSQLSDITASQRGKLYSLTEISDFLEKTKGKRRVDIKSFFPDQKLFLCSADLILRKSTIIEFEQKKRFRLKKICQLSSENVSHI
ncbi:UNVERIFIED_CONTAM: hypothetical protein FKN15_019508 [Acipenser sinensis]